MTRLSRILSAPTLGRALAEIAIIVVGVLIALGADAWWTARQEAGTSTEFLNRFSGDLFVDQELFRRAIEQDANRLGAIDDLLAWMDRPEAPSQDTLRTLINWARSGTMQPIRTGTWIDLTSTGRLDLIDDPELRDRLLVYYEETTSTNDFMLEFMTRTGFRLMDTTEPHLDSRAVAGHLVDDPAFPVLATSWDAFRTDPEVRTRLRTQSVMARDRARISRATRDWQTCLLVMLHDRGAENAMLDSARVEEFRPSCTDG